MRFLPVGLLVACAISISAAVQAAPSFQQAMADYSSGKYALALSEFQTFKASYPNNALVHYYVALCQQALGRIDQAKLEYKWVVDSRDANLAGKAATGLAQLSSVRLTGAGGGSSSSASAPIASSSSGGGQKIALAKVKKVIDFWADW